MLSYAILFLKPNLGKKGGKVLGWSLTLPIARLFPHRCKNIIRGRKEGVYNRVEKTAASQYTIKNKQENLHYDDSEKYDLSLV
jgi:hypothetical protein